MSDGDLQEGITSEAASLAAYYELDNLVVIHDSNKITIDGEPAVSPKASTEVVFTGLGWNVLVVPLHESGDIDLETLFHALVGERELFKPTLVILESVIGWPAPNWKGSAKIHGSVLTNDEHELTQSILGIKESSISILAMQVVKHYKMCVDSNRLEDSNKPSGTPVRNSPVLLEALSNLAFPKEISARKANGVVISKLQSIDRRIVGGSADLTESNSLSLDNQFATNPKNQGERIGSNLRFGVREHAMAAVINGLALDELLIPFCATYLVFSDYQKPAIRMAALMNIPSIFIWTHDSIAVGADGPTHQPVEHLAMLRAIPNFPVVRPASGEEVRQTWKEILKKEGPIGLSLSRQDLPNPSDKESASELTRFGAYVYHENFEDGLPEIIVIATGSELQYAYQAAKSDLVRKINVRVVSMPCQEWFREQPLEYKESVLPGEISKRISLEAGSTFGWSEFVGHGIKIGVDEFGFSGSSEDLLQHFGFTTERVIKEILNYHN
jgi:transketolase